MVKITTDKTAGQLYAGRIPQGGRLLGTVTIDHTVGGLVRLASGMCVRVNSGVITGVPSLELLSRYGRAA